MALTAALEIPARRASSACDHFRALRRIKTLFAAPMGSGIIVACCDMILSKVKGDRTSASLERRRVPLIAGCSELIDNRLGTAPRSA
jgi:hypothetical protein